MVREEHPDGLSHCSCQMGYDAIDRNYEIQFGDDRGRIAEVGECLSVIYYGRGRAQGFAVALTHMFLQRIPFCIFADYWQQ